MAAKLQCEICGGKLIGRPGGVFECDSCGMEYDTAWAKEKIQEITGTVKVEGTVEVTGKVQVEGPVKVEGGVNKEALLQRGRLALEDGQWDSAKEFFDQALSLDAEYADAWLGLVMADLKLKREDEFSVIETGLESVNNDTNYGKFLRFASEERKREIVDKVSIAEKKKQEAQAEDLASREEFRKALPALRAKIAPAKGMIIATYTRMFGLKANGTVLFAGDSQSGRFDVLSDWREITAIAANSTFIVGLKADGTVLAAGVYPSRSATAISRWKNIVKVAVELDNTYEDIIVGLKADGSVVAVGKNKYGQCNVDGWKDIVSISAGRQHTVGLCKNGTVVAVGDNEDGQCNVSEWKDVIKVIARGDNTVGLKSDGTVVATGWITKTHDVSGWNDVIDIDASDEHHIIGLRADGTVINSYGVDSRKNVVDMNGEYYILEDGKIFKSETGYDRYGVYRWSDIVAISESTNYLVGLKADGTIQSGGSVPFVGYVPSGGKYRQRGTLGWKLFESIETLEAERAAAEKKAAEERKSARLEALDRQKQELLQRRDVFRNKNAEYTALQPILQKEWDALQEEQEQLRQEALNLKGLFSGKRRREIEVRLAQITERFQGIHEQNEEINAWFRDTNAAIPRIENELEQVVSEITALSGE